MANNREIIKKGFSPIWFLWRLIIIIITLLLILGFIAIILGGISIIYKDKPFFKLIYSEIIDPIRNSPTENFLKRGVYWIESVGSSKKQAEIIESYTWKSTIDKNSKKQDLGVKITKFQATTTTVIPERFSKITAIAEGYASSIEPIEVEFFCLTKDDKLGGVANQNNILDISKNRKEFFTIKCIYDKDLFELEKWKTTTSKIKIRASYEFITEAYIPVYMIQKEILDEKINNNEEIFIINDPLLNKEEGTVKSVYTYGPVKLLLRSIYTQPYTEEGPFGSGSYYTLDIKIDDDLEWTGSLEEIEELELLIPEEIDIITENFEYSTTENNFKIYKAKGSLMEELNKVCEPKNKLEKMKSLIEEECWRRGGITTSIEFSVRNPLIDLSVNWIRAKIKYKFNDEKQDTITFLNTA